MLTVAIALFSYFAPTTDKPEEIPLSEAIAMSQSGEIVQIEVDGDALLITTTGGTELKAIKESNASIYDIEGLSLEGVEVSVKESGFNWGSMALNFLPLMIFGGLLFFLFQVGAFTNNQTLGTVIL